jgi:hypothetical protein
MGTSFRATTLTSGRPFLSLANFRAFICSLSALIQPKRIAITTKSNTSIAAGKRRRNILFLGFGAAGCWAFFFIAKNPNCLFQESGYLFDFLNLIDSPISQTVSITAGSRFHGIEFPDRAGT